jgi:hypothetical protein
MYKKLALAAFCALFAAPYAAFAQEAPAPGLVTRDYKVATSGEYFTATDLHLIRHGEDVIGVYGENGHISGKLVDNRVDGTWKDPRGTGWLTLYLAADHKSFNGEWGYHGKKPEGKLIGQQLSMEED